MLAPTGFSISFNVAPKGRELLSIVKFTWTFTKWFYFGDFGPEPGSLYD
jgi:hypothetical protein